MSWFAGLNGFRRADPEVVRASLENLPSAVPDRRRTVAKTGLIV